MSLTLVEAEKFSTNMVRRGVLETIIKNSIVLQKLPFTDIVGNAYQYLQENTLGVASFYDVGETWTEDTPTFTQKTAVLRIMGGDADVDQFLKATRSNYTDLQAQTIEKRAKGIRHTFLDRFFYGSNSDNSKEFDGLQKLMPTAQRLSEGSSATGDELTMTNLDKMLDLLRDGPADCLLMTREIRRRIRAFLRANGALYQAEFGEWAQQLKSFAEVPVYAEDFQVQTETIASGVYSAKTGGATSTIFAVRFGPEDLTGFQNSGGLKTIKIGQLETKDAERWRIKWYVSLGLLRDIAVACLDGITDAAAEA